jgi:hypothetical protein
MGQMHEMLALRKHEGEEINALLTVKDSFKNEVTIILSSFLFKDLNIPIIE